jgi:hypothetical protein
MVEVLPSRKETTFGVATRQGPGWRCPPQYI